MSGPHGTPDLGLGLLGVIGLVVFVLLAVAKAVY